MATQSDARLKGQEAGQQVNSALDTAAVKLQHGKEHTEDAFKQGQVRKQHCSHHRALEMG